MSKIEQDYLDFISFGFFSVEYPEERLREIFKAIGYKPTDEEISHLKQMTEDLREYYLDGRISAEEKSITDIWKEYGITITIEEVDNDDSR